MFVLAVILSAAKDPEDIDSPTALRAFLARISTVVAVFNPPQDRHFDRSCSQPHREQRSGEIRVSTSPWAQPRPPTKKPHASMITRQVLPKINSANVANFRARFKRCFPPRIHHKSTTIYHAKHHVLRTQFPKTPFKNANSPRRKKFRAATNLKPANKQFALVHHLGRQMIVQQQEQLLVSHNLPLPLLAVHNL